MMRVTVSFDSASTEEVRAMAVALHRAGLTATLRVGVNGPEAWTGETVPVAPNVAVAVMWGAIYAAEVSRVERG